MARNRIGFGPVATGPKYSRDGLVLGWSSSTTYLGGWPVPARLSGKVGTTPCPVVYCVDPLTLIGTLIVWFLDPCWLSSSPRVQGHSLCGLLVGLRLLRLSPWTIEGQVSAGCLNLSLLSVGGCSRMLPSHRGLRTFSSRIICLSMGLPTVSDSSGSENGRVSRGGLLE